MDVKTVLCGLEKMLKTGIVSASVRSNVNSSTSFCTDAAVSDENTQKPTCTSNDFFPSAAKNRLRDLCTTPWLPNPEVASIALIGGYLARALSERLSCESCIQLVEKPKGNAPVDGLIGYQDRGGLKYPTKELVTVLIGLKRFVDMMLFHGKSISKLLETSVEHAVDVLVDIPILVCENKEAGHRKMFLGLLCRKFIKPLLTNHAFNIRQKFSCQDVCKEAIVAEAAKIVACHVNFYILTC